MILNSITPTYAKGVKPALKVLKETRTKKKNADLFSFNTQKPLLPQIEQAIAEVTNVDYTKYVQYLQDIQNKGLLEALTKASKGKLTQAQANFANYLYLLVCDSHILTEYLKGEKLIYKQEERQALMDSRMEKLIQLWQVLENRARVLSDSYNNLPSTPATRLINQSMKFGLNIEDIQARKRLYTHSYKYNITGKTANGKQIITIRETTGTSTTTVTLDDISKLAGNNKSLKQFFAFLLIKLHEQAISKNTLRRNYIEFSLNELVDEKKMYKSIESARLGVNNNWSALKHISLGECFIKISDKKKIINDKDCVLFVTKYIKNNICKIKINEDANWAILTHFYTVMPDYCLSLSNKAFDLAMIVFNTIRLKAAKIKQKGYIDISYRQLQAEMGLPDEETCRNPSRDIKDKIEKGICEIEDRQAELLTNSDIQFARIGNENAKIKDYLTNGCLRVYVAGNLLDMPTRIAEKQDKQVKKAQKIAEKAKIRAMSNNISTTFEGQNDDCSTSPQNSVNP
jgi:hypothetical protein